MLINNIALRYCFLTKKFKAKDVKTSANTSDLGNL